MVDKFTPSLGTVFNPFYDAWNNVNWYGGSIIPVSMENYEIDQQYDDTTSSISKGLAKIIPDKIPYSSPVVLDYLLKQTTGFAGKLIVPMTDSRKGNTLEAFTRPFFADVAYSNDEVSKFYDRRDEMIKAKKTIEIGRKAKGFYDETTYNEFTRAASKISKMSQLHNSIPSMDDKTFRQTARIYGNEKGTRKEIQRLIKLEILDIAEDMNAVYDESKSRI
jgi:hypothetical protein